MQSDNYHPHKVSPTVVWVCVLYCSCFCPVALLNLCCEISNALNTKLGYFSFKATGL